MKAFFPQTAAVICVALALSGCTEHESRQRHQNSTPTPSVQPVVDAAPYLCDLVPERAFRNVTGVSLALRPRWTGAPTANNLCLADATNNEAPLGVHWSFNAGKSLLDKQEKIYASSEPPKLPSELGRGFAISHVTAGGNPRPNYAIALFRCGKQFPWLSIDIAPMVKGRDAVRDMVEFIRIAERRFGEIHQCKPAPR